MNTISPKHSVTGTNIFTVMSALANQHQAVNLSQGFPDFPIDEQLQALLKEAAEGNWHQYAPMAGLPLLREQIAKDFQKRYQVEVDPETEITITPGATYGIYTACATILQRDDEVIILEPAYDSYRPSIEMQGARVVPVPLRFPDFNPDWQRIKEAITSRTRAIIINTPHNPTGAVWEEEDYAQLKNLVYQTGIYIIADEVYEQLVFDNKKHISIWQYPELHNRSFVVFSFGKVFSNTGWKIGYVIAPKALTEGFRSIHQFLVFSVNTPAQYALAKYLQEDRPHNLSQLMQAKRDLFLEAIKDVPFTITQPTSGSYFQLAGYEAISQLPDREFAEWLTIHCGVAVIPVSVFYSDHQDHKLVRFCIAKKDSTLLEAAHRIKTNLT